MFGSIAAFLPGVALAATAPQWELAVIAKGSSTIGSAGGGFSPPAIDRLSSTGAWQVAFSTYRPATWADGSVLVPGVHVQDLGGAHKTVAKDLDPAPGGWLFCFELNGACAQSGQHTVSLSQGEVAFEAALGLPPSGDRIKGIFTMNGQAGARRVADTRTPMPGNPAATFDDFSPPSIAESRVVFQATGGGIHPDGTPAMSGVYGDLGGGLSVLSDFNTPNSASDAAFSRFTSFGPFPMVTRVFTNIDDFIVAYEAAGDSHGAPGTLRDSIFSRGYRNGVFAFWATEATGSRILSPSVDFDTGVAFLGDGPAIYRGRSWETQFPLVSLTTLVPGETAPFQHLGQHPAADAAPRQVGILPFERWTAFVGTSPSTGEGVYLAHDTRDGQPRTLEKVADGPALWRALSPWLGSHPPVELLMSVELASQGVKDGIVAFDVAVLNHFPDAPAGGDFIVVAMKTTPTLTLKADADTYVRSDVFVRQNDNYGMQDFLEVGTGRADGSQAVGAADKMRGLVHFNTGVLPRLRLNSAVLETTVHSYDNGTASSVYTVDAHRVTAPWATPGGEGNGFEGTRPPGAPANLTDPDSASGVAWLGAPLNPDPFAANNSTQPSFDAAVLATQVIQQQTNVRGDRLQWDITPLAKAWLDGSAANNGVALTDATGDVVFRGLRMGSREGEAYSLPLAVPGPRLALKWTVGVVPGDLTGDGCVDRDDLTLMMAVIRGQAEPGSALAAKLDVNGDGRVDIADARKLATLFSRPLGAPCSP